MIYTIFAGVNGAGKSILYQADKYNRSEKRINTDEIARTLGRWDDRDVQIQAGKQAVKLIKNYMEQGIDFNQETTLCGHAILRNIELAKSKGYKINLRYIGLESVDIAKERVKQRVKKGGHGIPEEVIEKRYKETLENLVKVIPLCDEVELYDNTDKLLMIGKIKNAKVELFVKNRQWVNNILKQINLPKQRIGIVKSKGKSR